MHAIVLIDHTPAPPPSAMASGLVRAGMAVENHRLVDDTTCVFPWVSEDGPRALRVRTVAGWPDGVSDTIEVSPSSTSMRLEVELLQGPSELLQRDFLLLEAVLGLLTVPGAVVGKLCHVDSWVASGELEEQLEAWLWVDRMFDIEVGEIAPGAIGVLSEGLSRYELREVLVVADEERATAAVGLLASVAGCRILGVDPPVDLSVGPHPVRPMDKVDVGFLDEGSE